jgi:O-antigen/teichoic acid export membrane protein
VNEVFLLFKNQAVKYLFNKKSWVYVLQLFLGVFFSLFSIKVFNVVEKGDLLYLESVSALIVGIFSFGFSVYLPIFFDKSKFDIYVYKWLIVFVLLIILVGFVVWIFLLRENNFYLRIFKILCFVIYLGIVYLKSINDTALQLINNFRVLALYILGPSISNIIIISSIFFGFYPHNLSPLYFFLILSLFSQLVTNLLAYLFIINYEYSYNGESFIQYFKNSIKLYPSNLFSIISKRIDVLVLGKLGPSSLGNYGVIVSIREVIMVFFRVTLLEEISEIKKVETTWYKSIKSILPLIILLTLSTSVIVFGFDVISNNSYLKMQSIMTFILFYIFSYLLYCTLLNFLQAKFNYIALLTINVLFIFLQIILIFIKFNLLTFLLFNSIFYISVFFIFSFSIFFNIYKPL